MTTQPATTSSAPIAELSEKQLERFGAFTRTRQLTDILRGQVFAEQILALPINPELHRVDDEATVGQYLAALLNQLLFEGADFDSKRPFGRDGWDHPIDDALNTANLTPLALRAAVRDLFAGGPVERAGKKYLDRFEALFAERLNNVIDVFENADEDEHTIDDIRDSVYEALGLVEVGYLREADEEEAA